MNIDKQKGVSLIITFFAAFCIFFIRRVRAVYNLRKFAISNSERGVSLIITFFVMIIVVAIVISVSIILYSEVKIIRNIGDSAISFFAADSGIEKVLYFDSKVMPQDMDGTFMAGATRGLCAMCRDDQLKSCVKTGNVDNVMRCNLCSWETLVPDITIDPIEASKGCNPDVCNYCRVSFRTEISGDLKYDVTADVFPSKDGATTDFRIRSKGAYSATQRQIEISIKTLRAKDLISIKNACANPSYYPEEAEIEVEADIESNDINVGIASVVAKIKDSSKTIGEIPLTNTSGLQYKGKKQFNIGPGVYYVDIFATSDETNPNVVPKLNIPFYPNCLDEFNQ